MKAFVKRMYPYMKDEDFFEIVHTYIENADLSKHPPEEAYRREIRIKEKEVEVLGKYFYSMNTDERKLYCKTKEAIV